MFPKYQPALTAHILRNHRCVSVGIEIDFSGQRVKVNVLPLLL